MNEIANNKQRSIRGADPYRTIAFGSNNDYQNSELDIKFDFASSN